MSERQSPPGRRSVDEIALEIQEGEFLEGVSDQLESLEDEEAAALARVAEIRLRKKLIKAPPEVREQVEELKRIQRRIIEGGRWMANANDKVANELKKLRPKLKKLEDEYNELKDRVETLESDNGKTYGQRMIDAATKELEEEIPKIEELLMANELDIDVKEILDTVR